MKKLLLLSCLLSGCITTTSTKPDGTVIKTNSQDPAVVAAIAQGVTEGAVTAGVAAMKQNGYAK